MRLEVQLHGAEQFARLAKRLHEMPQKVHDTLTEAIRDEAEALSRQAQKGAPVDTGALRASFGYRHEQARHSTISVAAAYGVPYAIFPHEKRRWSLNTRKPGATPGGPYPNRRWFVKAGQFVAKGLIGRVIRKLRPVLQGIYGNRSPV